MLAYTVFVSFSMVKFTLTYCTCRMFLIIMLKNIKDDDEACALKGADC